MRGSNQSFAATAVAVLLAVPACDQQTEVIGVAEDFSPAAAVVPVGAGAIVRVCKDTPDGLPSATFDFTVSGLVNAVATSGSPFTLTDALTVADCKTAATGTALAEATITELPEPGWVFDKVEVYFFNAGGGSLTLNRTENDPAVTVTPFGGDAGWVLVYFNSPEPSADGRMTGGGGQIVINSITASALLPGEIRVTRGFTLHCDIALSNNLEINWPGNHWHLTRPLTSAQCIMNGNPFPPVAPFNTFIGEGVGELNGVPGSLIFFTFVDSGEPGGHNDMAAIRILEPGGGIALDVPLIDLFHGNIQAHYDQPHGNKPVN